MQDSLANEHRVFPLPAYAAPQGEFSIGDMDRIHRPRQPPGKQPPAQYRELRGTRIEQREVQPQLVFIRLEQSP